MTPLPPRLLLVEFIAVDRFHRAIRFPFIKGWCRSRGIPAAWIRLGLSASHQFERRETGIGLGAGDLRSLLRTIRLERATHALFDPEPSGRLVRSLRSAFPGLLLGCLQGGGRPSGMDAVDAGDVRSLARWLGMESSPEEMPGRALESVEPDFGWTAGNPAAGVAEPLPFIIGGRECGYDRPISGNPCYRGVPLGPIRTGCAFCARERGRRRPAGRPLPMIRRQLRALRDTHPPFPGRPFIRAQGEELFLAADKVIGAAKKLGMAPSDFLFDARADRLVRHGSVLRSALRRCRGSGHRVHLGLVGIENFSSRELDRMNKGTTPAVNLAAIRLLLELERAHPDVLAFREHGGMSMILFTPWTSVRDLLINLAVIRELGLSGLCGKLLAARLRLYPELPLARLARRDGLLTAGYRDPLLDTARRNFYAPEVPWRFQHPGLEPVSRVFTRLPPDPDLGRDPLYRRVQSWSRTLPPGRGLLDAAHAVALAAASGAAAAGISGLLERARTLLLPAPDPGAVFPGNEAVRSEAEGPDRSSAGLAVEARLRPVRRIEGVDQDHIALCRRHPGAFPNLRVRERRGAPAGSSDVFFSLDQAAVEEAVDLTEQEERSFLGGRSAGMRRIVTRIGVLLGYPECCARAFSSDPGPSAGSNGWRWVALRAVRPGRIPALMHPDRIRHVPCSLACRKSLEQAEIGQAADVARYGPARAAAMADNLRLPSLMLLDPAYGDPRISLIPEAEPSERFRYRASSGLCGDPRLSPVVEGDEMVLEDGCVTILKRGRELAFFPLNAFLWWHERVLHADFWRSCVALRTLARQGDPADARPGRAPSPVSQEAALLKRTLKGHLSGGLVFSGYRIGELSCGEKPRLGVTLVRGSDRVGIFIERRSSGGAFYASAGDFAVVYDADTPLDTPDRVEAVAGLVRHLDAFREKKRPS